MATEFKETTEHIDVGYVAHLARLQLADDEKQRYQQQLDQILDYAKELNELDVEGVEPMAHPRPMNNVFRADLVKPGLDRDTVLANAPQTRNHQFVVPKIVE